MGRRLIIVFEQLARNRVMAAIRRGLVTMMPIMIIGSFAVLLNNIPIPAFWAFMESVVGPNWRSIGGTIYNGTFQIMSLCIVLSVSYALARSHKDAKDGVLNPLVMTLVSLACLITFSYVAGDALSFSTVGPMGVFIALFVALTSHFLFVFFFKFRFFRVNLFNDVADSLCTSATRSIEPALWTIVVFGVARYLLVLAGVVDIHAWLYAFLQGIFTSLSSNFSSAALFVASSHLFWFCGLHGNNILENVAQTVWVPKLAENIQAVANMQPPTEIFTKQFFDVFVFLGGSGATLCLIIALIIAAKRTNIARFAGFSSIFAIFNINEIMVYGLPIVFNPIMFVPFIFTPLALLCTTYFAMSVGLVPLVISDVSWTTPIILGGYNATGSIAGSILQLFNLAVGTLIYYPFAKVSMKAREEANLNIFRALNDEIEYVETVRKKKVLKRDDDIGNLARTLAADLERELAQDGKNLFMVFQPQVNSDGKVVGCEALFRWKHEKFGFVAPPSAVTIAQEAGLALRLNLWIITTVAKKFKEFRDLGYTNFLLSMNLSPLDLAEPRITSHVVEMVHRYRLDPHLFEIEVTENIAFEETEASKAIFNRIKAHGMKLAIDDFGMGHTSLLYFKTFDIDTLKLDGSLVAEVDKSRGIIKAICDMARVQNIAVVAEMVEDEHQIEVLKELGVNIFQGYFYSKPLQEDDFINFLKDHS